MNPIYRVSKYLLRYPWLFSLTLAFALGTTAFALFVPKVIQYAVDRLLEQANTSVAILAAVLMLASYLGRDFLNFLRIRVNNLLEQKVLIDIREEIHAKLLELPISFYDRRKSGDIASRVIEDVNNVERALLDGTEQGSTALLMLIGVITMLFLMNGTLAALIVLPLPIVLWLGVSHARATRLNHRDVRETSGEMNSMLVEDIQANRIIQSFALQERESKRFRQIAEELRVRTLKVMWRWSIYNPGTNFISSLGLVSVVGYGGYLLSQRLISAGEFIAFFAYASMLYEPLGRLNGINHMLAAGKASGERVFEIIDHPVDIQNPENPIGFDDVLGEIRYEDVGFAYPDRPEVLQGFNLTLKPGEVTALVGHTGAGKSTVANLLLRYYDVTSGRVTLNGHDVREYDLADLRSHIGYVAQEPFLFDGTVRTNLALANANASEPEMIEALRSARAWDFVQRLPQGMDTLIGERGVRLSQGEKQRLTIARIMLRNPHLVILDEATSSVDTETEKYIQEALDQLMKGRTVVVIAHRLSTVRHAHNIVCLDRGSIIEQGCHEDLIRKGGQYAKLWQIQADILPE
ncbi:MAG: ABC transporter ATP-binding protein [Puniceicoccaceae bacterium]